MFDCKFCGKECKSKYSVVAHEGLCKSNPNKRTPSRGMLGKKGGNQWTKAKESGRIHTLNEETRKKLSVSSSKIIWSDERKEKHSKVMRKVVDDNPSSYNGNFGKAKKIEYDGIVFHGKWELTFYQWCKEKGLGIEKCQERFDYFYEKDRKYNPDFYLPETEIYVEVKGLMTEKDVAKWNQFPKTLRVIKKQHIQMIKKNTFTIEHLNAAVAQW